MSLPKIAILSGLLAMTLSGCPGTTPSNTGSTELPKDSVAVVAPKVFGRNDVLPKMRDLKVTGTKTEWTVAGKLGVQRVPASRTVVKLRHGKGDYRLEPLNTRKKPYDHIANQRAPIRVMKLPVDIVGLPSSKSGLELKLNQQKLMMSTGGGCDALTMYSDGENAYVATAPEPIDVTFDGNTMHMQRRGSSEGRDVNPVNGTMRAYFHPCPDPEGIDRVVVADGGLTAIDIVDNIIDPNAYSGQSNEDPFIAEALGNMSRDIALWNSKKTDYPCEEAKSKVWPRQPVACLPLDDLTVTIYCNNELVIIGSGKTIRIDLLTCGAILEQVGDKLAIYDGCEEGPDTCN